MKGNSYLLSIVEASRQYNIPRDKLYAESRKQTTEIPFITIGNIKKIHVPLLEKLLTEKVQSGENLF